MLWWSSRLCVAPFGVIFSFLDATLATAEHYPVFSPKGVGPAHPSEHLLLSPFPFSPSPSVFDRSFHFFLPGPVLTIMEVFGSGCFELSVLSLVFRFLGPRMDCFEYVQVSLQKHFAYLTPHLVSSSLKTLKERSPSSPMFCHSHDSNWTDGKISLVCVGV